MYRVQQNEAGPAHQNIREAEGCCTASDVLLCAQATAELMHTLQAAWQAGHQKFEVVNVHCCSALTLPSLRASCAPD